MLEKGLRRPGFIDHFIDITAEFGFWLSTDRTAVFPGGHG